MTGRIKVGIWLPFAAGQTVDGRSFAWRARVGRRPVTPLRVVEGDAEGNSFFGAHAAEVDAPLTAAYEGLPELILGRLGEESDPTRELI